MTDDEIILSMECCNSVFSEHRCKDCPMQGNFRCSFFAIKNGIDLINRQKAEIERLKSGMLANAEVVKTVTTELKKAKSEAIKEFAERLCEGRVSNDPVVIAVKVELECMKEMTENDFKE